MAYEMGPCWNCGYPVGIKVKICPFCEARLKRSGFRVFLWILGILGSLGLMSYFLR